MMIILLCIAFLLLITIILSLVTYSENKAAYIKECGEHAKAEIVIEHERQLRRIAEKDRDDWHELANKHSQTTNRYYDRFSALETQVLALTTLVTEMTKTQKAANDPQNLKTITG